MSTKTRDLQLGSGMLYLKKVTDEKTIPSLADICVEDNLCGHIKGGCVIETTLEVKDIYCDLHHVEEHFITNQSATMRSGLLCWNRDVIRALVNNETETSDGALVIGAEGGMTRMNKYIIAFEAVPSNEGIVRRFGFIGVSANGLTLAYNPEDPTTIDVEFRAVADEDGRILRIEEDNA